MDQCIWSGKFLSCVSFVMGRLFYETLSPALFCSQKTVSRLSVYTIIYAVTANRSWLGCQCLFYQHNILNLCAVTANCYSREIVRSCQLCSHCDLHNGRDLASGQRFLMLGFSTWPPFIHWQAAKQHSWWSYGLYASVSPSAVLKVPVRQCAQRHPLFYALISLLSSISRYKQNHTRAPKKDGDSDYDLIFSQTYFHSVSGFTCLVLSAFITCFLKESTQGFTHLSCFSAFFLAHRLDPQHGDNMTNID